jgi:hypothetical protein
VNEELDEMRARHERELDQIRRVGRRSKALIVLVGVFYLIAVTAYRLVTGEDHGWFLAAALGSQIMLTVLIIAFQRRALDKA